MPKLCLSQRFFPILAVAALILAGPSTLLDTVSADDEMIELTVKGKRIEGLPLQFSEEMVHLLGRDGQLWNIQPDEAKDFRRTTTRFRGDSPSELRARLLRELGPEYEVTGTGHYLVAHAKGQRDKWAERFEDLYRSFVHYFGRCGLRPGAPPFPLVAIVCRDRNEFARRAALQGAPSVRGVLGYYDLQTNVVNVYDMGNGGNAEDWKKNASVLIHEATHQTAFNTGIHSRYTPPPKWLAEGLAMLFEAPGVYDSRNHPLPSERINVGRNRVFRQLIAPRHRPEMLASLVASDQIFASNPNLAYAESWAFSFFLIETDPQKYAEYLRRTAMRPMFQPYTAAQRTADFVGVFGSDWRMLEARFMRFMKTIE